MVVNQQNRIKDSLIQKQEFVSDKRFVYPSYSRPAILGSYMDPFLCRRMIEYFNDDRNTKTLGEVTRDGVSVQQAEIKNSIDCILNGPLKEEYLDHLTPIVNSYMEEFPYAKLLLNLGVCEEVNIQKYDPPYGGFHRLHAENVDPTTHHRQLVFMTYLNTVLEGGETEFPVQHFFAKPVEGLTLIWPANFEYPHRGLISNQVKYIATGWLSCIA